MRPIRARKRLLRARVGGFHVLLVTYPRFSFFSDHALDLFVIVIEAVKKPAKSESSDTKKNKIYECDVCKAEVEDGDDALECEICKGWFHISCVDISTYEYEVLVRHKIGSIHWYCATCNIKSMELLRLVFGLQNRLQKAEYELDSMKKDTDAKFA